MSKSSSREPSAVEVLRDAWVAGRPIVPFLGAGISAGSGFPLVDELRNYLLKVTVFIKYGGYRVALGQAPKEKLSVFDPENNPAGYLTEFGWPNPNQINLDLYRISATRLEDQTGDAEFVNSFLAAGKDTTGIRCWTSVNKSVGLDRFVDKSAPDLWRPVLDNTSDRHRARGGSNGGRETALQVTRDSLNRLIVGKGKQTVVDELMQLFEEYAREGRRSHADL